jgi:hypothetical protein
MVERLALDRKRKIDVSSAHIIIYTIHLRRELGWSFCNQIHVCAHGLSRCDLPPDVVLVRFQEMNTRSVTCIAHRVRG